MNKRLLYTLMLLVGMTLQAGALEVANTAGNLANVVSNLEVTDLTVTGTMDARDFYFIAESLPRLTTVNLEKVTVKSCVTPQQHYGKMDFDAGVLPIGAFADKAQLTTIVLPATLTAIDEGAFAACRKLTTITFPETLESVGAHAFASCEALTAVTLPATVRVVGDGAFARCTSLTSFSATGLQQLARTALMDCPKLTQITLSKSLTLMGERVLAGSGITALDLSTSTALQTIGEGAFVMTPVTTAKLPDGVTTIGEAAFLYDTSLSGITLPSRLTTVSDYMLAGSGLTGTVSISDADTVGNYALYNATGIESVALGAHIDYIGTRAMAGLTGMTSISSKTPSVPTLGELVWAGVDQASIPLTVPYTAIDDYRATAQWMEFMVQDWLRGDVNGDGEVTVADVNAVIDIIMGFTASEATMARADVNGDGEISVADVNEVIDIILRAGDYDIPVNTTDHLTMDNVNIASGEELTLTIGLDNSREYSALQCDITLPAGLTLVGSEVMTADRSRDHLIQSRVRSDNTRAVLYSMTKQPFDGNEGAVLTITVRATASLPADSHIKLTNIMLADNDNVNWHTDDLMVPVTNSTGIDDLTASADRVWATDGMLHIATNAPGVAQVVALSGVAREIALQEGENEQPVDAGVYIVRLNGKSHKVVVK